MHSPIIRIIICFERIIIGIIVYGRKRKTCIIFGRKINNIVLDGRKIKYVPVAHTSLLVLEKKKDQRSNCAARLLVHSRDGNGYPKPKYPMGFTR